MPLAVKSIRIEDGLWARLEARAELDAMTTSAAAVRAIEAYLGEGSAGVTARPAAPKRGGSAAVEPHRRSKTTVSSSRPRPPVPAVDGVFRASDMLQVGPPEVAPGSRLKK